MGEDMERRAYWLRQEINPWILAAGSGCYGDVNMSYDYRIERPKIFTEDGQETFLKIRDRVKSLLSNAGAAMSGAILRGVTGDGWTHLACLDRLVELGEIRELTDNNARGQDRVFIANRE